jgi:hypothetical protein
MEIDTASYGSEINEEKKENFHPLLDGDITLLADVSFHRHSTISIGRKNGQNFTLKI